jgi:UDP-N-acetyl-D-galactosamine dehydrogenase
MHFDLKGIETGVVGLGYVGLPLAVEFGGKYLTVDFDIKSSRIEELVAGTNSTLEILKDELSPETQLEFSSAVDDLAACNFYFVIVRTPIGYCLRPCATLARHCLEYLKRVASSCTNRRSIPARLKSFAFRFWRRGWV